MPKHGGRTLTVRCNSTNTDNSPPSFYPAGKYEYNFPRDDMNATLIDAAITQYRAENDIPERFAVTTTTSIRNNR